MSVFDHQEPKEGVTPDCADLSLYFAKIMTSPHNQHVIVRVVGKAGKGKSWLGGALSYGVSSWVAKIRGGEQSNYFSFKEDLAVIAKEEVIRVMNNPRKYAVKFLDDVAAKGMNARNYRDDDNIDLNSTLTTFRPEHNLVLLTTQAGFLIDKVPRSMSHYLIEMDQPLFDFGMSLVKCFELEFDESSGELYRHYLRAAGGIYKRHVCYAPPKEFTDAYEAERAMQLERMKAAKETSKEDAKESASKKGLIKFATPIVFNMVAKFPGLTQKEIVTECSKIGLEISQASVSNILSGYTYG